VKESRKERERGEKYAVRRGRVQKKVLLKILAQFTENHCFISRWGAKTESRSSSKNHWAAGHTLLPRDSINVGKKVKKLARTSGAGSGWNGNPGGLRHPIWRKW